MAELQNNGGQVEWAILPKLRCVEFVRQGRQRQGVSSLYQQAPGSSRLLSNERIYSPNIFPEKQIHGLRSHFSVRQQPGLLSAQEHKKHHGTPA
jgi:hypothetical protein